MMTEPVELMKIGDAAPPMMRNRWVAVSGHVLVVGLVVDVAEQPLVVFVPLAFEVVLGRTEKLLVDLIAAAERTGRFVERSHLRGFAAAVVHKWGQHAGT